MANLITVQPMSDLTPDKPATARVQLIRLDGVPVEADLTSAEMDKFQAFIGQFDGKGRVLGGTVYQGPQDVEKETKPEAEFRPAVPPPTPIAAKRAQRDAAGRVGRPRGSVTPGNGQTDRELAQAAREWAATQGIDVPGRGRLSGEIKDKFLASQEGKAFAAAHGVG
jgi:Lsr2 protein